MNVSELELLKYFSPSEKDYYGHQVEWANYHGKTMLELDRLRHDLGVPCKVIRGSHGFGKETAVDCVFPTAPYEQVVMTCMRSAFSKGFYDGGSLHLDTRTRPDGLARCWLAFKPERVRMLRNKGLMSLKLYEASGWLYFPWGSRRGWELLSLLLDINAGRLVANFSGSSEV